MRTVGLGGRKKNVGAGGGELARGGRWVVGNRVEMWL